MGTAITVHRLVRRNNYHHNSSNNNNNNNNVDNNTQALLRIPRTASPNVDDVRWRGIERGQTTFTMRAGRQINALTFVVDCRLLLHWPFFFFFAFFRQPSRTLCHTHSPHSLSSCGLHCISTCLDRILPSRCVATHSHHLPLLFSRGCVAIITSSSRLFIF